MTSPLLLLDTASLYYRAFFGVPDSLRAADGTPVNAVRGLLDMIAQLVMARRPSRMVACWDEDWRPQWRVDLIPAYKSHRVEGLDADGRAIEQTPQGLAAQIPIIVAALAAVGIARVGAPGFEADDVIATLAARERGCATDPRPAADTRPTTDTAADTRPTTDTAADTRPTTDTATDPRPTTDPRHAADTRPATDTVEIVTGDRDLFQLVDDGARVRVLYPARGVKDLTLVTEGWLAAKYGVASGTRYADMAVLRGDPSDGLRGVPGIGEKTAVALLDRYGDLAGVLAARDAHDPGLTATQQRRLTDAADYLTVAPAVVRVRTDAPIESVNDDVPAAPVDPERLAALASRWNLSGPVSRLVAALAANAGK